MRLDWLRQTFANETLGKKFKKIGGVIILFKVLFMLRANMETVFNCCSPRRLNID